MILEDDKDTFVPIGGTIKINGKEYVCMRSTEFSCIGCEFFEYADGVPGCAVRGKLACAPLGRCDKSLVIFKEVEEP